MTKKSSAAKCSLCKLVTGEKKAHKIYEDEKVVAFLDPEPVTGGHTVIIPKKHQEYIWDLDQDNYQHLMLKARDIALRQRMIIKPLRIGVVIDGSDAPHAHFHLIPLKKRLKETLDIPEVEHKPSKKLLQKLSEKMRIQ
ncbi:MAG: HIT family protein [Candidatus Saccharimonadales bacterium]|nr:HIT family protein [Candidatus Saccharimonadales bacterium]